MVLPAHGRSTSPSTGTEIQMSIKQVISQLNQLDAQVQGWASGRTPLPDYNEVVRLRVKVAALLYVPMEITSVSGEVETSLGSCTQQDYPIPEPVFEKLLLLRSQILDFDQQLSGLQHQMELMMHRPRKAAIH